MLDYESPLLGATILSWIATFATTGRVRTHAWKLAFGFSALYVGLFQPQFLVNVGILSPLRANYLRLSKGSLVAILDTNTALAQASLFTGLFSFVLHQIMPRQRELVLLKYALGGLAGLIWLYVFGLVFTSVGPFPL